MYRQNITQNVEPAMASPASLQRASELSAGAAKSRAAAVSTLIGAAGTAYETKQFMDMRQLQVDSEFLSNQFLETGRASEEAARTLPVLEEVISFDKNVGPLRDEDYAVINNMKAEANRLRGALEGGMSNVQFEARVADLTRKYLARYPGMGDKIRQIVGAATGLPGADRWAASSYVQERFSPKKPDANSDAMIKKDIDFIVANKPEFGHEELYNMRATGDPRYFQALNQARERAAIKANNVAAKENLEQATFTTVPELQAKAFDLFESQISVQLVGAYDLAVQQGTFQGLLARVQRGEVSADELVATTAQHTTRMLGALQRAYTNAKNDVIAKAVSENLNKSQQDEILSALNTRYESEKLLWGDKNSLLAQALVEQNYANDTLDKKLRLVNETTKLMATYPTHMVESYFTNPQLLKATAPDIFNSIDGGIKLQASARSAVIGSLDTTRARVGFTIKKAEETGEIDMPTDATVEEQRSVHQAISANVVNAVEVYNKTPAAERGELTENMVRNAQALFTGVTPQGGGLNATKYIQTFRKAFVELPDDDKAVVKAAASEGAVATVNNINNVISNIESKYGIKLEFGTNDAGKLGILPAPSTPLPVDMSVPLVQRVDPNWSYSAAREEAIKQVTPMLENLVNTRLMVDERDERGVRDKVAKEMASVINSRQPYAGFYSLEPKAPAATSAQSSTIKAPAPGTVASMADISAIASQNGISIDDAINQMRAAGYTIDED
jgi:hypothetical protein